MSETETNEAQAPQEEKKETETSEDPGLLESVGSFPCWMLKIIDTVTPDILRTKEPPKKNYRI